MLRLHNIGKSEVSYPLLVDTKYTVGRKQGDINFPDDQSVSRVHAEVLVEHPAGNINEPLLTPVLTLTDVGSKFGTYATEENINSKTAINARERVTLSVGDKLRFGLQWNEYKVDYTPLVVTSSSFKATADFKAKIVKLGGHFVSEWNGYVTHVVMESLTLTVKAVCALLAAKPIVTPAYIIELVSAFETHKTPPDANAFMPTVVEKDMQALGDCFQPNSGRTTLFAGKTFLFCTNKHMKKIAVAVEAGGGTAKLISDVHGQNVLSNEYIIMGHQYDVADGEKDPNIKEMLDIYRKGGKRLIPDSEIGLAAVYNSISQYCNPKCDINIADHPHLTTQTQSNSGGSVPIVPETQDVEDIAEDGDTSVNIVNETIIKQENSCSSNAPAKVSRGEKRSGTESGNSSKKRVAEESLPGPRGKRIKDLSLSSRRSQSQSNRLSSQQSNSRRMLTSLFNMSSSDEEDIDVVPESQPVVSDKAVNVENEDESNSVARVNVVDVRNLQSVESTPQLSAAAPEEEIFRVPASPEMVDPDESLAIRNPGTDFIKTVTTSVMNAKTIPVANPSIDANMIDPKTKNTNVAKRLQTSNSNTNISAAEQGPSRKRPRQEDESSALAEKTKKINLNDQKQVITKKEEIKDEPGLYLPLIKKPLMNKNCSGNLSLLGLNDSKTNCNGKNFKSFCKVLPKFIASENSNVTVTSDKSGDTTINLKPVIVKMKRYDYYPGETGLVNIPPPLDYKPERGEQNTPEGFLGFDDNTSPFLGNGKAKAKSRDKQQCKDKNENEEDEPTSSRDKQKPSTSGAGRRTSPRKKGPAVKLPSRMPAPPPPPVMQFDQMEEDDEDDMWSFNR